MSKKEREVIRGVVAALGPLPASVRGVEGRDVDVYRLVYKPLCDLIGHTDLDF